jgi:hypothetical protein
MGIPLISGREFTGASLPQNPGALVRPQYRLRSAGPTEDWHVFALRRRSRPIQSCHHRRTPCSQKQRAIHRA